MTTPRVARPDLAGDVGENRDRIRILEATAPPVGGGLPTAYAADYSTSTALTAGVYYPSFDLGRTNDPDVFTWENQTGGPPATKYDYVGLNTDGVYRAVFQFFWFGADPTAFIGMDVDCEVAGVRDNLIAFVPYALDETVNTPVGELDSASFWTYSTVTAAVDFDYDSVREAEGPPLKISCRWYYNQANHTRSIGCNVAVVRLSPTPYSLSGGAGDFG